MQRIVFGLLCALALLPGCATLDGGTAGDAVLAEAPGYRVGDRWVYRVTSGWRMPLDWEETQTVTAVDAGGATVAVAVRGPRISLDRVERWTGPGLVAQGALFDIETRRFREPLVRYRFPLRAGARWNQFVDNYNEFLDREGVINRYVRVAGVERVTTPAGTFEAVRMQVFMRLDDGEFWRWPTDCTYTIWYAPAAKATVREVRRADYLERGNGMEAGRLPAQDARIELVSFTPGA